jgi:glutathione peroxidase
MKSLFIVIIVVLTTGLSGYSQQKSFYDFTVKTIEGEDFPLSRLKGKKVLVVNTASKCGYTPQYADLEEIYKQYGGEDFTILGFPSNDFGKQEPGTNEEIASFCQINYGVTFQMMEKVSVKGDNIAPLYSWLTNKSQNGVLDAKIGWNFHKFLIDENGKLVRDVKTGVKPTDDEIVSWITGTQAKTAHRINNEVR